MHLSPDSLERARAIHQSALILDSHVDTMSAMLDLDYHLDDAPDAAHLSWDKIDAGGLKGQIFACWVDPDLPPDGYAARVDAIIDTFEAECARTERLVPCRTAADVEAAFAAGKFAGMLSIEGGHAIENSLETLRRFHGRGIRALTLVWNNTNDWADGCGPMDPTIEQHGGLTDFGREVVGTMNEIGMAVDLSHSPVTTFQDVMAVSTAPPFCSHSCTRRFNDHRRNLTDAQMRELAERGGVLGVCGVSGFLVDESAAWAKAKRTPEYAAVGATTAMIDFAGISAEERTVYDRHVPLSDLEDLVNHTDHALRVMGTDHVAIGTDFDGASRFPRGMDHVGLLPQWTAGLLERGWKESELEGFLGRNLLDYLRRVIG
jgi:membrane dipeptidase